MPACRGQEPQRGSGASSPGEAGTLLLELPWAAPALPGGNVPETAALGVPGRPAAVTTVPISKPHQLELCAHWDSWPGAVSVQPGPLLRGGGAGTRRSRGAPRQRELQAGQRRAPSFPGLIKPCLTGEGGESITLSHPGLLMTSDTGQRLGGSERAGLEPGPGGCPKTGLEA